MALRIYILGSFHLTVPGLGAGFSLRRYSVNRYITQHSRSSGLAPVPEWAARTLLLYITLRGGGVLLLVTTLIFNSKIYRAGLRLQANYHQTAVMRAGALRCSAWLLVWGLASVAGQRAADRGPSEASLRKGVTATLIRKAERLSQYTGLIERTRAIGLVRALVDAYDHVIFHDGPMDAAHESHIRQQVGEPLGSRLQFIDVAARFHSRDGLIGSATKNAIKHGCPATLYRSKGYHAMCSFWYNDIPEVLAVSYSHLLRIDDDCVLLHAGGIHARDPAPHLHNKGVHIAAMPYSSDDAGYAQGLEAFFAKLAQNVSHHPERRWSAVPHTVPGRLAIPSPYTNVMWLDLAWARSDPVRSVREAVDASGCVASNRWGDLILWGATMRLLGEAPPMLIPGLTYLHISHNTCVGSGCAVLRAQTAYSRELYALEVAAREHRLHAFYGGDVDRVVPWDGKRHMYLWDFFPPSFPCAMKERVGNFAEGGKVMCNPAALRLVGGNGCHVLSFGVSGDVSFESMLAARTPCVIHANDPTVSKLPATAPGADHAPCNEAGGRVTFRRVGLGTSTLRSLDNHPLIRLEDHLKELGGHAHVLKVDVEAAEWEVFKELSVEALMHVDQLLIELHFPQRTTNAAGPDSGVRSVFTLFRKCEAAGLYPFSWEVNHNPSGFFGQRPWAIEYSFVRIDSLFTKTSLEFPGAANVNMTRFLCQLPRLLLSDASSKSAVLAMPPKPTCVTQPVMSRARHQVFDVLGAVSVAPTSCGLRNFPELVEGPKKGDDDKRLCSAMLNEHGNDVVVSIGSNNEFGFEEQVLKCAPSLHVATFDCTVREATNKPRTPRVSFHPYCISSKDSAQTRTWASIASIASESAAANGNPGGRIAILKMDIEGWEWVALPQVLNMTGDRGRILPRQIAVEVHLATHQRYDVPGFVSKGARAVLPRHQEQLRELRRSMEAAGYALVDRNDNPWCGHCSELLFVRVDSSFTVSADSAAGRRFYPVVATLFASIVTACPFL